MPQFLRAGAPACSRPGVSAGPKPVANRLATFPPAGALFAPPPAYFTQPGGMILRGDERCFWRASGWTVVFSGRGRSPLLPIVFRRAGAAFIWVSTAARPPEPPGRRAVDTDGCRSAAVGAPRVAHDLGFSRCSVEWKERRRRESVKMSALIPALRRSGGESFKRGTGRAVN